MGDDMRLCRVENDPTVLGVSDIRWSGSMGGDTLCRLIELARSCCCKAAFREPFSERFSRLRISIDSGTSLGVERSDGHDFTDSVAVWTVGRLDSAGSDGFWNNTACRLFIRSCQSTTYPGPASAAVGGLCGGVCGALFDRPVLPRCC